MQLGVYCETLSPKQLSEPAVLQLLGEYGVTLGHALRFTDEQGRFEPDRIAPYLELAEKLRDAGGRYCLWPLLPKNLGYWINERNLDAVEHMIDALLEGCRRFGAAPDLLVMDIETPWQQMEALLFPDTPAWRKALAGARMLLENRKPQRFAAAARRLDLIAQRWRENVSPVSAAVFPLLIADEITGGHALQDYLEMPIFPVRFDGYNAMFYNSYLPKAMPFLIPADAAQRFLFEYAFELEKRLGKSAWVTLGSLWEGVIPGNEGKIYYHAHELEPDVAAAKAAGIETIWLYCLEGVLYSDQPLTKRREPKHAAAFFEVVRNTCAERPAQNEKWSRNRSYMEWLLKDRFRRRYRWD